MTSLQSRILSLHLHFLSLQLLLVPQEEAMGFREDIQKRIEKKQAELIDQERAYERDRAASLAYIQALQDMLKSLPREPTDMSADKIFRKGSAMARAREMILAANRPLHISEILRELGKTNDHNARASLSGALGAYVRRGEIFARPKPNTFGLVELGHHEAHASAEEEPPEDFGSLKAS
jgi:hypothetical protein